MLVRFYICDVHARCSLIIATSFYFINWNSWWAFQVTLSCVTMFTWSVTSVTRSLHLPHCWLMLTRNCRNKHWLFHSSDDASYLAWAIHSSSARTTTFTHCGHVIKNVVSLINSLFNGTRDVKAMEDASLLILPINRHLSDAYKEARVKRYTTCLEWVRAPSSTPHTANAANCLRSESGNILQLMDRSSSRANNNIDAGTSYCKDLLPSNMLTKWPESVSISWIWHFHLPSFAQVLT